MADDTTRLNVPFIDRDAINFLLHSMSPKQLQDLVAEIEAKLVTQGKRARKGKNPFHVG